MEKTVRHIFADGDEQCPGIPRTPPNFEGQKSTAASSEILRVKFISWRGRGAPPETMFHAEPLQALKTI